MRNRFTHTTSTKNVQFRRRYSHNTSISQAILSENDNMNIQDDYENVIDF